MKFKSLLPLNSTKGERAIEQASTEPLIGLNTSLIRQVKNPRTCPENLLPWLAWEHAVDYWDHTWSKEQKIQTIESAAYVHRHRGTTGAVRRSLAAVGYPSRIIEWWQEEPRRAPYTFRIEIYVDGEINAALFQKMTSQVNRAKNLRSMLSSIDVNAVYSGKSTLFIGGAVTAHIDIIIPAGKK